MTQRGNLNMVKDFIKSIDEIDPKTTGIPEAERVSFEYKVNALQRLVFERFRSLTIIATVCFAVIGISLSFADKLIKNYCLSKISFGLALVIAFVSLGRYLFLIRSDISEITQRINKMRELKWLDYLKWVRERTQEKEFRADYWPEGLYAGLVISVILFLVAIIF